MTKNMLLVVILLMNKKRGVAFTFSPPLILLHDPSHHYRFLQQQNGYNYNNYYKNEYNNILQATSSRELQERNPNKIRLARAVARIKKQQPPPPIPSESAATTTTTSSLRVLNQVILETTLENKKRFLTDNSKIVQTQDSMTMLLGYHHHHHHYNNSNIQQVIVVFGKTLGGTIEGLVSVEYASRIQQLVQLLNEQQLYYDSALICFCAPDEGEGIIGVPFRGITNNVPSLVRIQKLSSSSPTTTTKSSTSSPTAATTRNRGSTMVDSGFTYFQQLMKSQGLETVLSNNSIRREYFLDNDGNDNSDIDDDTGIDGHQNHALSNIVTLIKKEFLTKWLASSAVVTASSDAQQQQQSVNKPQKRLHIHFTLISTDYHLCNLNDIHRRSPNQSLLRPLEQLEEEYYDDHHSIETSWSFRYATYPFKQTKLDTTAFLGKCFVLNEQLLPLLLNLRGVVNEKEFFQRENYMVLATVRRGLVSYMEDLYKSSLVQLRSSLRQCSTNNSADIAIDVILEGAILSLGRCMDVVRPAGLHVGTVSKEDYYKALKSLEHCMGQIRTYCDPDQPLPLNEWGKLDCDCLDGALMMLNNSDEEITEDNYVAALEK